MSIDTDTSFSRAIEEHLSLKQRNAGLDDDLPIDRYAIEDPFENHPLFKSEEQARLEETMETAPDHAVPAAAAPAGALPWPGEGSTEGPALDESLWGRSRDFDWGD